MEKEEAGTAAAGPAPKEQDSHGNGDLISRLPNDILGAIISLLPAKEGGRTQAISRRWRHLFFSAPLNLEVRTSHPGFFPTGVLPPAVSKIVSEHPGPARRFCFPGLSTGDVGLSSELESWFRSPALANLKYLEIRYAHPSSSPSPPRPLLPSLLLSASTLLTVSISYIDFPDQIAPSLSFPLLKQLSLRELSISGDVFRGLISACTALESLFVSEVRAAGRLHVCSATLRSIGVRGNDDGRTELVMDDTPRLERILLLSTCGWACRTIRINVMKAPKLEVLGPFTPGFSKLQVFQGLTPVSLANSMRSVKVLAVGSCNSQLDAVLSVLTWFPCLEKLHVIICYLYEMDKTVVPHYDPLQPIECLQTHLKHVVLQGYSGHQKEVDFFRFFISNAEVLNKIEVQAFGSYDIERVANLRRLLQREKRASLDVQFESGSDIWPDYRLNKHMHDLSVGDPFRHG